MPDLKVGDTFIIWVDGDESDEQEELERTVEEIVNSPDTLGHVEVLDEDGDSYMIAWSEHNNRWECVE